jgi:hypothetical protein
MKTIRKWYREYRREGKFLREHRKEYWERMSVGIIRVVFLIITISLLAFFTGTFYHQYGLAFPGTIYFIGLLAFFLIIYIYITIEEGRRAKMVIADLKAKHHYNTNH